MTLEEFRALLGQALDFYNSEHTSTEIDEGVSGGLGAVRYDVPQTLAEAQKATARQNLGISSGGAGGGNFEAVYDVTTAAEIEAAYQAGIVITMNNNGVIFYLRERINENMFVFTTAPYYVDIFKEIYIYTNTVDGITWSSSLTKAEPISNKVTTIDETSTNKQYPSAKAVFDFVNENGGGGGGSGADLLNADGIIKQQYFPAGYPYSEFSEGVIFPTTTIAFNEALNGYPIMSGIDASMFIAGTNYTVTWNGTPYTTTAIAYAEEGLEGIVLGDFGAMTGGTSTGEPFVIIILPLNLQAGMGVAAQIMPLDGTTGDIVLSISGMMEVITPISSKFLPTDGASVGKITFNLSDITSGGEGFATADSANYENTDVTALQNAITVLWSDQECTVSNIVKRIMTIADVQYTYFRCTCAYEVADDAKYEAEMMWIGTNVNVLKREIATITAQPEGFETIPNVTVKFVLSPDGSMPTWRRVNDLEFNRIILISPSNNIFTLTVDDNGTLTTTPGYA